MSIPQLLHADEAHCLCWICESKGINAGGLSEMGKVNQDPALQKLPIHLIHLREHIFMGKVFEP